MRTDSGEIEMTDTLLIPIQPRTEVQGAQVSTSFRLDRVGNKSRPVSENGTALVLSRQAARRQAAKPPSRQAAKPPSRQSRRAAEPQSRRAAEPRSMCVMSILAARRDALAGLSLRPSQPAAQASARLMAGKRPFRCAASMRRRLLGSHLATHAGVPILAAEMRKCISSPRGRTSDPFKWRCHGYEAATRFADDCFRTSSCRLFTGCRLADLHVRQCTHGTHERIDSSRLVETMGTRVRDATSMGLAWSGWQSDRRPVRSNIGCDSTMCSTSL